MLLPTAIKVDSELDFVNIKFGTISARIGYRIAFVVDHHLRLAAKRAARFDRANAKFWREVDLPEIDKTKPSRVPQQSRLSPTVSNWQVGVNPPLVLLSFDGMSQEMDYETAIKVGHALRRAGQRAKAWAGDSSKYSAMLGLLTDAEEDYKLGIG